MTGQQLGAPQQPKTDQQGLAVGPQQIEALRRKVIVGRVIGVAIGLAIWWLVIRPTLGDNPLVALVALGLVTFGGQCYGTMVVGSMVGGKR